MYLVILAFDNLNFRQWAVRYKAIRHIFLSLREDPPVIGIILCDPIKLKYLFLTCSHKNSTFPKSLIWIMKYEPISILHTFIPIHLKLFLAIEWNGKQRIWFNKRTKLECTILHGNCYHRKVFHCLREQELSLDTIRHYWSSFFR